MYCVQCIDDWVFISGNIIGNCLVYELIGREKFNLESIVNQFKILIFTSYMFMSVGEFENMLIVLTYVDGEVQHGFTDVSYSVPSKVTFPASKETTFEDVKSEICRGLGVGDDQYNLNMQARLDIGAPGPHYFQLVPIYEEIRMDHDFSED